MSKIFLPFYRSPLTVVQGRGAGLGLAITKGLLEIQGGKLWVESTKESGSQFFFTLPLSGVPTPAVISELLSTTTPTSAPHTTAEGSTITTRQDY